MISMLPEATNDDELVREVEHFASFVLPLLVRRFNDAKDNNDELDGIYERLDCYDAAGIAAYIETQHSNLQSATDEIERLQKLVEDLTCEVESQKAELSLIS